MIDPEFCPFDGHPRRVIHTEPGLTIRECTYCRAMTSEHHTRTSQ